MNKPNISANDFQFTVYFVVQTYFSRKKIIYGPKTKKFRLEHAKKWTLNVNILLMNKTNFSLIISQILAFYCPNSHFSLPKYLFLIKKNLLTNSFYSLKNVTLSEISINFFFQTFFSLIRKIRYFSIKNCGFQKSCAICGSN